MTDSPTAEPGAGVREAAAAAGVRGASGLRDRAPDRVRRGGHRNGRGRLPRALLLSPVGWYRVELARKHVRPR